MDDIPKAIPGKWYWKEDSSSLEFQASVIQAVDPKDKKGRKKNLVVGDYGGRRDRLTPNRFDSKHGVGTGVSTTTKSQRHGLVSRSARSAKGTEKDTTVTLARVKTVTLSLLNEVNVNTESFEKALCGLPQFDEFLLGLLNYFAAFFDKLALGKPKQAMTTQPSQAELRAKAEIEASMATAQRKLAQSYCVLVLGMLDQKIIIWDVEDKECPQPIKTEKRMRFVSLSNFTFLVPDIKGKKERDIKDPMQELSQSLYRFCVHFVWIVFSRKEHELISKEVGRLLRSDVFNPALRVKHAPPEDAENLREERRQFLEDTKLTPAERRRQIEKRPAITSIVNKRSPVIVSLLPTPKEKNGWLFDRLELDPVASSDEIEEKNSSSSYKTKVGIIGEPLNLFNTSTLAPLGSEQDEENSDETQSKKENSANNGQSKGLGRQLTAQSQATDVFSDDEEQ
ncbi:hypothetical protein BSL78_05533 [Apostichopus japonicus]|uniref:Uncharacterized protein n=1 Tax=Stichopus japonicus TaxID=307972 RepID=A0A2G8LBA2_STIJA|nr:hypothetical protein BSL78_05533 [Apostichopus japonicus]